MTYNVNECILQRLTRFIALVLSRYDYEFYQSSDAASSGRIMYPIVQFLIRRLLSSLVNLDREYQNLSGADG